MCVSILSNERETILKDSTHFALLQNLCLLAKEELLNYFGNNYKGGYYDTKRSAKK